MELIEETKAIEGIPVIICKKNDNFKKPIVIFSHYFTGSKKDIKDGGYLVTLAEMGYYAVAIDNRLHGDRPGPGFHKAVINSAGKADLLVLRRAIKETADDVRLLLDKLCLLNDADEERIAMIGVSMGGFVTYRCLVIDDRIKVGIPIISSPYWDDIPGDVDVSINNRKELQAMTDEFQPSKHIDRFYPKSVLMQIGDRDKHYDKDKVTGFYYRLKDIYGKSFTNLELIVHKNTEHNFKIEMWLKALKWLKEKL